MSSRNGDAQQLQDTNVGAIQDGQQRIVILNDVLVQDKGEDDSPGDAVEKPPGPKQPNPGMWPKPSGDKIIRQTPDFVARLKEQASRLPYKEWDAGTHAVLKEWDAEFYYQTLYASSNRSAISEYNLHGPRLLVNSTPYPEFPWKADQAAPVGFAEWESFFHKVETYEAQGHVYSRDSLLTAQTHYMNCYMELVADQFKDQVDLMKWRLRSEVPISYWKQAVLTLVSREGMRGTSPFILYKTVVRKARTINYLNVTDTVGWTSNLKTMREQVNLRNTTIDEERELIRTLRDSLGNTYTREDGFGLEARNAFRDLFERAKTDPNASLDLVLGQIRKLHDQYAMSLAQVHQFFSVEVLQTAIDAWNEEGGVKRKHEFKTGQESQQPKQLQKTDHKGVGKGNKDVPHSKPTQGNGKVVSNVRESLDKSGKESWGQETLCRRCGKGSHEHSQCRFADRKPELSNQSSGP